MNWGHISKSPKAQVALKVSHYVQFTVSEVYHCCTSIDLEMKQPYFSASHLLLLHLSVNTYLIFFPTAISGFGKKFTSFFWGANIKVRFSLVPFCLSPSQSCRTWIIQNRNNKYVTLKTTHFKWHHCLIQMHNVLTNSKNSASQRSLHNINPIGLKPAVLLTHSYSGL